MTTKDLVAPQPFNRRRAVKDAVTGTSPNSDNTLTRLRELLASDLKDGQIKLSKGSMINRSHYARYLGLTPGAMASYQDTFLEFEQKTDTRTGPLRHLDKMRSWLTEEYQSGRIKLRDGKIDRGAFADAFSLRGGTFMVRHPEIAELIKEFDDRAKKENYLPDALKKSVDSLRLVLAGNLTLNKDRLTINLEIVSKSIGIPVHRLATWPYDKFITEKQDEVSTSAKASKVDPYFHGRVHAFSDLSSRLSLTFLERVGIRFKQIASGLAEGSTKQPYLSLYNLLNWIASSTNPHCVVVRTETKQHGRALSQPDWEEAVFAYRASLVEEIAQGLKQKTSVDATLTALRTSLEGLSSGGVVPAMSYPLPGIKLADRTGQKRKSIAEVTKGDSGSTAGLEYIKFAKARLLDARRQAGIDPSLDDDNFLQVLAEEMRAVSTLPHELADAIRQVLKRRLDLLRAHAAQIVQDAARALEAGRTLIEESDINVEEFESSYFGNSMSRNEKNQLLRRTFPLVCETSGDGNRKALANLLRLIEARHGGIPPSVEEGQHAGYGQFFKKRYLELGGQQKILPMLIPDAEAVGAVLTLYLVDSGANISVGRTLLADCIEQSDVSGHRRITGLKAKAQGKPIIIDLPESSHAVRSMSWLEYAGQSLRKAAGDASDWLFVARIGGSVKCLAPEWYTAHFAKFANSIDELQGLRIVPSMIRSSVLLEASLSNDGRLKAGIAIGQNSETVSQGYQQKWPTRLLYDQNIRHFSTAFETLVLANVPQAAERMGVTPEIYEERLQKLMPTGLGTLCASNGIRPDNADRRCEADCWNECPSLLLVAEVNAIAALQLWQKSLREAEPDWQRDRPERWDEVWLPWLCLTDVVEEKMSRGPLIKIWRNAQKLATELAASDGYIAPRPW